MIVGDWRSASVCACLSCRLCRCSVMTSILITTILPPSIFILVLCLSPFYLFCPSSFHNSITSYLPPDVDSVHRYVMLHVIYLCTWHTCMHVLPIHTPYLYIYYIFMYVTPMHFLHLEIYYSCTHFCSSQFTHACIIHLCLISHL